MNKENIINHIKSNYPNWKIYSNESEIILVCISDWINISTRMISDLMFICQINSDNININCGKATIPCEPNKISVTISIRLK